MGICLFCNKEKDLIDAHIIPRWAYDFLYPQEGPQQREALILVGKFKPKKRWIGTYDQNILCAECDNYLGKFDDYGKKIFLDSPLEGYPGTSGAYLIPNVDLKKLKLFVLSVIWRMSISTNENSLSHHILA